MNKIILVTTVLMMGHLTWADCHSDSTKFREDFSAEMKNFERKRPKIPVNWTQEETAEYNIKKAAFKKEKDLALENYMKESKRRSDECIKAGRAEREIREKPRREEMEAIGKRIEARQKEREAREANQPKQ